MNQPVFHGSCHFTVLITTTRLSLKNIHIELCVHSGANCGILLSSPSIETMSDTLNHGYSTNPPPGHVPPPRNKGLIAGLIKGNQWLISPDHKAGHFWGGYVALGGGWLNSHTLKVGSELTSIRPVD